MIKVIKAINSTFPFGVVDTRLISFADLVYKDNYDGTYQLLKYRHGANNIKQQLKN